MKHIKILFSSSFLKAINILLVVYSMIFVFYLTSDSLISSIEFFAITFTYILFIFFHGYFLFKIYKKLLTLQKLGIDISHYKASSQCWYEFKSSQNPVTISLSPLNNFLILEVHYSFPVEEGEETMSILYKIDNQLNFEVSDYEFSKFVLENDVTIHNILTGDFEKIVEMNFAFKY